MAAVIVDLSPLKTDGKDSKELSDRVQSSGIWYHAIC
jgi:hypothetical protein